jgi:DNA-binding transcriptional LysR family regulator
VIRDLDIRLLRHFVAVAEELHFTRAAAKAFVAQQALSRDIRTLEDRLGTRLLERSTRRVALTVNGERLLRRARPLLAQHDDLVRELRGDGPGFLVDIVGEQTTPAAVLSAARRHEDGFEYYAHHGSGLQESVARLRAGTLDVAFGRWPGPAAPPHGVGHRLVRHEPMALLMPQTHPLAASPTVTLSALRGLTVCCRAGNHITPEWEDAALALLTEWGAQPGEEHPYVRGFDEVAHHVRPGEPPVLTVLGQPGMPGAVVRPLVDPVPVFPWSMFWRSDRRHRGLDVLHATIDQLDDRDGWRSPAEDH